MTAFRKRMIEDIQVRNLSPNTQDAHVQQVALFARYFKSSPETLGPEHIRSNQVCLTKERKWQPSSVIVAVAALRFLYPPFLFFLFLQPILKCLEALLHFQAFFEMLSHMPGPILQAVEVRQEERGYRVFPILLLLYSTNLRFF
jgi:hypothetical protein